VSGRVTGSGSALMSLRVAKYGMNVLQTHRRYISCGGQEQKHRMNEMESPSINKNQLRLAIEPENNKLKRRP
jgi:hypothetical protein